jgi:hypothetical protein
VSDPAPDVLMLGAGLRRGRSNRVRVAVVLLVTVALAVAGGLVEVRRLHPALTATEVAELYDPGPEPELAWSPPSPMRARLADIAGVPTWLGSDTCQETAPALFNYLPPGSIDGSLAPFGLFSSSRYGISSTARFPGAAAAAESLRQLAGSLERCDQLTLPAPSGPFEVTISGTPVVRTRFAGSRVRYLLQTAGGSEQLLSTLIGVQLGNTVTWQTRSVPSGITPAEDAEHATDAVIARIRAVAGQNPIGRPA